MGIANLLLIPFLEACGYTVDYNTAREWVVTTPEDKDIVFERDTGLCDRMPYIDMRDHEDAVLMVQTVRKNFEGYIKREVKAAFLARKAQAMVGHPADKKFKQMVSAKSIKNCDVQTKDVTNAHGIFGPSRPKLRGGTVRQKPQRVEPEYLQIPRDFYALHKFVTLVVDVMFVNGLPLLTTLS